VAQVDAGEPVQAPTSPVWTAAVTVQTVLDLDAASWPGLPDPASARQIEEAVSRALRELPGTVQARSRVVAVLPLPESGGEDGSTT
jgi:hypothetical protein